MLYLFRKSKLQREEGNFLHIGQSFKKYISGNMDTALFVFLMPSTKQQSILLLLFYVVKINVNHQVVVSFALQDDAVAITGLLSITKHGIQSGNQSVL